MKKNIKREPMDVVFRRTYKNAEMEVVVEEDVITTAKIYMDGECTYCGEVEHPSYPNGLPWNKFGEVYNILKAEIDKQLAEDGREEATNMLLIKR